ncbi:MAG: type II secretion system protein [Myxococcota bacterium]
MKNQSFSKFTATAGQKGMTLIEIMIVIVILGMIIGVVTFGIMPRFRRAKKKASQLQLNKIERIIVENSEEPEYKKKEAQSVLEGLVDEGMLKEKDVKDTWGTDVRAEGRASSPCVISAGEDESFGTPDDLQSDGCDER